MSDVLIVNPPRVLQSPAVTAPLCSEQVACPLSSEFHQWRKIHSEMLPIKVQDAYKLIFVHEKFMLDVYAARKTIKYSATKWVADPETSGNKRTITYSMNFGPKTSNCTETQISSNMNRAGEVYVVACEVNNEGVPMADSFSILLHLCLRRAPPPESDDPSLKNCEWCRYTCYAHITYRKTVWGVLKGQLERSAYSGMEGVHRDVAAAVKDYNSGKTGQDSSRGGIGALRRKKRTKTASSDFSSRFRRDDSRQLEDLNWCNVITNSIFVLLLFTLLVVNILLYSRVTQLEHFANYGSVHSQLTAGEPSDKLKDVFTNIDGGVWAPVLDRHETLYPTELRDMGLRLQQASIALNKADDEVQKVLQRLPKTMGAIINALQLNNQRPGPPAPNVEL